MLPTLNMLLFASDKTTETTMEPKAQAQSDKTQRMQLGEGRSAHDTEPRATSARRAAEPGNPNAQEAKPGNPESDSMLSASDPRQSIDTRGKSEAGPQIRLSLNLGQLAGLRQQEPIPDMPREVTDELDMEEALRKTLQNE